MLNKWNDILSRENIKYEVENMPIHKPKFQRKIGFSDRERQILEALMMYRSVRAAARVLHLKETTIRTTIFRIRHRYDRAALYIEEYHKYKKEMPLRKYL
jgi:DNA-binding NarL/FixJ family response regulator